MDNLDLRLLVFFDEVYKTGSLTRAAERLGVTQPGASLALRRLREHFGDALFVRTAKGMAPTPLAEALIPNARVAIAALQATLAYRLGFDAANADRVFRVSITDVGQIVLLPPLLDRLSESAPRVRIEVSTIDSRIDQALAAGELDLAVGFVKRLGDPFFQQLLFEDEFACLARSGHPRVAGDITRHQYESESHVVVATAGTGHQMLDRTLESLGVQRRVSVRIPSFLGLATVIGATDHLCTLPRRAGDLMAARGGVKLLKLPFAVPTYPVKQHWHARQAQDPGHRWLRQLVTDSCGRATAHPARPDEFESSAGSLH